MVVGITERSFFFVFVIIYFLGFIVLVLLMSEVSFFPRTEIFFPPHIPMVMIASYESSVGFCVAVIIADCLICAFTLVKMVVLIAYPFLFPAFFKQITMIARQVGTGIDLVALTPAVILHLSCILWAK